MFTRSLLHLFTDSLVLDFSELGIDDVAVVLLARFSLSLLGSALGARALGIVSSHLLMVGLGGILLISAYKVFTHARHAQA